VSLGDRSAHDLQIFLRPKILDQSQVILTLSFPSSRKGHGNVQAPRRCERSEQNRLRKRLQRHRGHVYAAVQGHVQAPPALSLHAGPSERDTPPRGWSAEAHNLFPPLSLPLPLPCGSIFGTCLIPPFGHGAVLESCISLNP
jgi:hypothetical protein